MLQQIAISEKEESSSVPEDPVIHLGGEQGGGGSRTEISGGDLENTLVALVAVMEKEVVVTNPVLQKEMTRMVQHVHRLGT
jgi:hypothetical protein